MIRPTMPDVDAALASLGDQSFSWEDEGAVGLTIDPISPSRPIA